MAKPLRSRMPSSRWSRDRTSSWPSVPVEIDDVAVERRRERELLRGERRARGEECDREQDRGDEVPPAGH